ncbi:MAG: sterol desaturase family protein [Bdellovibrio sp.]
MALIIFIVALIILTVIFKESRERFIERSGADWLLDSVSNLVHFFALPFLNTLLLFGFFSWLLPQYNGSLSIGWLEALGCHALLDYAWYWNHRLFHADTKMWNYHKVHHAPTSLDPLKTPRNSVLSHFLMVYWWFIGLITFLAEDPTKFLILGVIASMINYWGHSDFDFSKNSLINRLLKLFFIMPRDHHWHHSRENSYCNFGTVFSIWDRLHGTLYRNGDFPKTYGFETEDSAFKQLLFPSAN